MLHELHAEVVFSAVFLFIDGFEFALKEAEDRVDEAFAVQLAPLGDVLWSTLTVVHGFIEVGVGIDACAAIAGQQF